MNLKNKLAIFDLDGTLFDTNLVNYKAYKNALNDYGYDFEYDYFLNSCLGKNFKDFLTNIVKPEDMEEIHKKKKLYYEKYVNFARPNYHLLEIIKLMKSNYIIVIGTNASLENTKTLLRYYNVYDLFDDIISITETIKPKPDPDIFLLAMEKYNIKKEDTIIFEDSDIGIYAANKTGANVIKIMHF